MKYSKNFAQANVHKFKWQIKKFIENKKSHILTRNMSGSEIYQNLQNQ